MVMYGCQDRAATLAAGDIQEHRRAVQRSMRMKAWLVALAIACIGGVTETGVHVVRTNAQSVALAPEKINPNIAEAESLMRLDGIGPSRASAIVAYRSSRPAGQPAFATPEDLEKIKGIGPVTVNKIRHQLCFN